MIKLNKIAITIFYMYGSNKPTKMEIKLVQFKVLKFKVLKLVDKEKVLYEIDVPFKCMTSNKSLYVC